MLSLVDAAEAVGRTPDALRKAAERGALEAVLIGRTWVTTREATAAYVARVAAQRPVRRPDGTPSRPRTPSRAM